MARQVKRGLGRHPVIDAEHEWVAAHRFLFQHHLLCKLAPAVQFVGPVIGRFGIVKPCTVEQRREQRDGKGQE